MSLVLGTIAIATVIWLLFKLIWLEIPSAHAVKAMRKIHGPNGLPFFIGETVTFMKMGIDDILSYIEGLIKLYPRMSGFYISGIPMVMLYKPQDVKHILGSNKHIKKGVEYDAIIDWLNEGLLTSHGTKWHTRRKLLTPTFHFKILEDALSGMVHNTDILARKLSQTNGQSTTVDDYITRCTLDVLAETAMGVELKAQTETKNQYLDCVKSISEILTFRLKSVYLINPILFKLSSNGRNFYETLKSLYKFTDKVIAERKEICSAIKSHEQDALGRKTKKAFLDSLIAMQKANPDSFTDQDIREEVDTFMFEGHDTTSSALCFALWLLGSHPEVQEKVYQEIMDTVGDGEMSMTSLNNMNYLERVIKETLRLYPSVSYISRRLTEDLVLDDGLLLPASTNAVIVPFYMHRDPEYFPEPEKFDPDRFTEEASAGRHPYAYIPFSAGPRNCVGQKFAMLEMKTTLASVIRMTRVESLTKKQEFKVLPTLITKPSVPLKCIFVPRSKSTH